jgi:hypothetical protein
MAGWIKLHRKILENPIFLKPDLYQLFSYCLLRANHCEKKILWNGKEEILEKGCFITGRKAIAADLHQNERTTYDRLKFLEKLQMISIKSNNKYSIVKVLNYCVYQGEETDNQQPTNNQPTTNQQPTNTDKNVKNVKNDKELYIDHFEEFWKLYPKKVAKTAALKNWKTLIANKVGHEGLVEASKGYAKAMNGKDQQFILQASTFLGPQKRYEDFMTTSEKDKPTRPPLKIVVVDRD